MQDRPETVDIGTLVEGVDLASHLFRRGVGGGAEDIATEAQGRVVPLDRTEPAGIAVARQRGDPPVHDVDLAEGAEKDVLRLQVPMEDALPVGVSDGVGDADETGDQAPQFLQRTLPMKLLDGDLEGLPIDQLHRVAGRIVEEIAIVDGADAWMRELREDAGFARQPLVGAAVVDDAGAQGFDRNLAVEIAIVGGPHRPHAADRQRLVIDLVATGLVLQRASLAQPISPSCSSRYSAMAAASGVSRSSSSSIASSRVRQHASSR